MHLQWILQQTGEDPMFIAKVSFTDKVYFAKTGITIYNSISPSEMTVFR
jgi:hypothetical protein